MMKAHDVFWNLEALSDRQLLERLGSVLGSSRRLMAELVAHLGEVEERRLHLEAACSSMFAYCLKLGMTEDEAYRRIEVARLARRYPAIFPLLANGQLSLSVVALLKHHLSDENHLDLLASAAGKTVGQTRELIAARFPRPDVPSSVRKLPDWRTTLQPSLAVSTPTEPRATETEPRATAPEQRITSITSSVTGSAQVPASPAPPDVARLPPHSQPLAPPRVSSRIEPLSAQRYKVQLTGSAELARKLELARDLMRHSHPGGELGPIVERALDLLIESLMQLRFGKKASSRGTSQRVRQGHLE